MRVFQNDMIEPERFLVTLELVPGREAGGRSVDTVIEIARQAYADGRISAVSITDNPGGNPALSPDALGHEIFKTGMDVIVHFTCRDMNRVGIESRALQLARMGIKNILALNGDYSGQGFGGQGAPVFDLDSVQLQILLGLLSERIQLSGDPDGFFSGCAVSPFKYTEAESFAQYAKLCRKAAAGARFVITQLGYDARKFAELIRIQEYLGMRMSTLGTVYVLTPKSAASMFAGKVPGAVISNGLYRKIQREWRDKASGRQAAVERAARLAAVLKGLGYKGIHIGGIHRSYTIVGEILDRLSKIEDQWQTFLQDFAFYRHGAFYAYESLLDSASNKPAYDLHRSRPHLKEHWHYALLKSAHTALFDQNQRMASVYRKLSEFLDARPLGRMLTSLIEHPSKRLLLDCRKCGDCGIQHMAYLCPESQCPKHIRNGACGGSRDGSCEVNANLPCVWFRVYERLAKARETSQIAQGCIPPRMWELNQTSAWLNFHLGRDHQGASTSISRRCGAITCRQQLHRNRMD